MGSTFASATRPCLPTSGTLLPNPLRTSVGQQWVAGRHTTSRPARYYLHPIKAVATGKETTGKKKETNKVTEPKDGYSKPAPEVARTLYADMFLGREFEERCAEMYYRGKMFGDHVHALSKGVPASSVDLLSNDSMCKYRLVMAELFGKQTGICRGQGGSMHMFSAEHNFLGGFAFIGEGIPVGIGAAFQSKYRKDVLKADSADQVTCSFFGDGTCNNGQFYECLNMASLYNLPHIFVVENNLWAIGMQHQRATSKAVGDHVPFIYKKGPAFGFPGVHVDGMDVLKVRQVAMEAVERARRGDGPTLIECETYRYRGHSLADPDELRSKKEKEMYQARDPIVQFRKAMLAAGILTQADFDDIEARGKEIVEDAIEFADKSPNPVKAQLLENVFADPKGFGIGENGTYRFEQPGFTSGNAEIS